MRVNGESVVSIRKIDVLQTNFSPGIPQQRAGQKSGFHQNLKSVTDADHRAATGGKLLHACHHRRKFGDGAATKIVAIGESARQDDSIDVTQLVRIMPDKFGRLPEILRDCVPRVVIAIASRKDNDTKVHRVFCGEDTFSLANRDIKDCMFPIDRRGFGRLALALGVAGRKLPGSVKLDETMRDAVSRRKIPAAVAMVATADKIIYEGAFGKRDSASGVDVTPASIFRIASMTKAVTSVAALQLVEKGKLKLDEPVARQLPELGKLEVLEGFDNTGKPVLRPAIKPVTLRLLLTHTAGFAYDGWDEKLSRYAKYTGSTTAVPPLVFEPGARWEYGVNIDWTGKLVEAVSGQTLDACFREHILGPLGMSDTGFSVPAEKFDRLVSSWQRQSDGVLKENPRTLPTPPKNVQRRRRTHIHRRRLRALHADDSAGRGRAKGTERILQAKTLDLMLSNQTGPLQAGILKSVNLERSLDVDFHPGSSDRFTFGFLLNTTPYEGGRSSGSLAWAGLLNTYFWIDPRRHLRRAIDAAAAVLRYRSDGTTPRIRARGVRQPGPVT